VTFVRLVENVGQYLDAVGVVAIVLGVVWAAFTAVRNIRKQAPDAYRRFRRQLGRSILLGLELLVAADIIKTVAAAPTLQSIAVLSGIVLIRTFLSFSLELEISGRWPWQKPAPDAAQPGAVQEGST